MPALCSTTDLGLIYDLDRDICYREQVLSGLEAQWDAYERGELPVYVAEGYISRLFLDTFDCKQMFELEEEGRRSFWVRRGNASAYVLGRKARVEHVVFHAPEPVGDLPVITKIWIPDEAQNGEHASVPAALSPTLEQGTPPLGPMPFQNEYCRTGRIAGICRGLRLKKRAASPPALERAPFQKLKLRWPTKLFRKSLRG